MKIAFFGTAQFSANILDGLLGYKDIEVAFVVSQEDKRVGRKKEEQYTQVKKLAIENSIPVLQPKKLKGDVSILKESTDIDFFVVVAYGKIIPQSILNIPKHGSINLHGSLLPKYRGASPVQESLKNGDKETGLTTMYMSAGMDEGDILIPEIISIDKNDSQVDIFAKFEDIGPSLLYQTLQKVYKGELQGQAQDDSLATYCHKIKKSDGDVLFNDLQGIEIYNRHRAYSPWPGIFTYYNDLKFDIVACELGEVHVGLEVGKVLKTDEGKIGIICMDKKILILKDIKLEGKRTMNILDFVNGNPDFILYKFS